MRMMINEELLIEYNECDCDYIGIIIDYIKIKYPIILSFFGLESLDKKVYIKLWDNKDNFRDNLKKLTGFDMPIWAIGMAKNDATDSYSRIDYLSLREIKNIDFHKNKDINDLKKGIVHELVHICHTEFCNYNYPDDNFVTEGVATYLANQYEGAKQTEDIKKIMSDIVVPYNDYRFLFDKMMEVCNQKEIQEILKGNNEKLNDLNILK